MSFFRVNQPHFPSYTFDSTGHTSAQLAGALEVKCTRPYTSFDEAHLQLNGHDRTSSRKASYVLSRFEPFHTFHRVVYAHDVTQIVCTPHEPCKRGRARARRAALLRLRRVLETTTHSATACMPARLACLCAACCAATHASEVTASVLAARDRAASARR